MIDRNENMKSIILRPSNTKPFAQTFGTVQNKSHESFSIEKYNKLYSSSKAYDKYGAVDCITNYCQKSIADYEEILKNINKTRFETRKIEFICKNPKILLNFTDGFVLNVRKTLLSRFLYFKND